MIPIEQFQMWIDEVEFLDWEFRLSANGGMFVLQVLFQDAAGKEWKGRKWLLSTHMTKSEVIQTAFLAVKQAMEHEIREHFLYQGRAVFGPHIDVDVLHENCEDLDVRPERAAG